MIEEIGAFREDMPRGCCQQYFRRLAKRFAIDYVEDIVLDYYRHKDAITAVTSREDIYNSIVSFQIKIDSIREDLERVPQSYSEELIRLGHSHCLYGQMAEGRSCFRQALRIGGFSIPSSVLLLGSMGGSPHLYKMAHKCSIMCKAISRRIKREG